MIWSNTEPRMIATFGTAVFMLNLCEFPDPCIPITPISMLFHHCQNYCTYVATQHKTTRKMCWRDASASNSFQLPAKTINAASCCPSIFWCNFWIPDDSQACDCIYPELFAWNCMYKCLCPTSLEKLLYMDSCQRRCLWSLLIRRGCRDNL